MSTILTNLTLSHVIEFLEKCFHHSNCNYSIITDDIAENTFVGEFELQEVCIDLPEINMEILDVKCDFSYTDLSLCAAKANLFYIKMSY